MSSGQGNQTRSPSGNTVDVPFPLQSVSDKIGYAIIMCERAKDHCDGQAGLWYHTLGMMNAFYAIVEEIKRLKSKKADALLGAVVRQWVDANTGKLDDLMTAARHTATHEGKVETTSETVWEVDVWNDTEFPTKDVRVTVPGHNIDRLTGEQFLAVARGAFDFLQHGVDQIERDFMAGGGTKPLRHKEKAIDPSSLFGTTL